MTNRTSSWVPNTDGSGFGLANLPYGVVRRAGKQPSPAVRIGDHALVLSELVEAGLLQDSTLPHGVFSETTLNAFLALGRPAWTATRQRLIELLSADNSELQSSPILDNALVSLQDVSIELPIAIGDYVDFYSSIEHATNLGRMFRPDSEPLLPNWRHLPVAYHGRASSVVVSGTPVTRPAGQRSPSEATGTPTHGPTRALDIELELGFVTGPGNQLGSPIPIEEAADHIFGMVLVNDWSARDIQKWEYQPLGPFLGKSFATSVSPWIVPLEALAPFRTTNPVQTPPPLEYLKIADDWAFDIDLQVGLSVAEGNRETVISHGNSRSLYWNIAQQLTHVTTNGTNVRPGDLYASGTISGTDPGTYGSLIELTWGGKNPLALPGDIERVYLQDGDTVTLRGMCDNGAGLKVSFGEVTGTVKPTSVPANASPNGNANHALAL